MVERICPWCHKKWMSEGGARRYCSTACRYEAKKERDRIWSREKRFKGDKPKQKPEPKTALGDASIKAKSMGLSYGAYMALKEGRC